DFEQFDDGLPVNGNPDDPPTDPDSEGSFNSDFRYESGSEDESPEDPIEVEVPDDFSEDSEEDDNDEGEPMAPVALGEPVAPVALVNDVPLFHDVEGDVAGNGSNFSQKCLLI
ncbi:hypothetical protein A2U01_0027296, partial [Trifolium medium]|nr:hypothetical protein [Trifolium medium]